MEYKYLELLSPAKNLEQGVAAIGYGADAVYVGAPSFGAREAAANTYQDVEKLISYAHRYRAKVFVALNTIIYEPELEQARKVAIWAYEAGADALIIQDMAFLEMGLPPIALHASTQTHNTTPQKARFLQDVGFERVILARELSFNQISEISQSTQVELEAFVHGALCVSYSGQCYMSEALVGRSANRGACAQPCRASYDLVDGSGKLIEKGKHLLSLKDFNLSDRLEHLADAGVCSFKIEGRLKGADYVKNVTALYRQKLDSLLEGKRGYAKASSGKVYVGFTPDAQKSFNRGFTSYFAEQRNSSLTGFDTAKAVGQLVGTVAKVSRSGILAELTVKLANGDGICFISKEGRLIGTNINRVDGGMLYPNKMDGFYIGAKLYRNYDHTFTKQLETDTTKRLVDASLTLSYKGKHVELLAEDEDGNTASLTSEESYDAAQKPEKARQTIEQQLQKAGSDLFKIAAVAIEGAELPFMPISAINSYRRELLERLETARCSYKPKQAKCIEPNSIPYPAAVLDYSANVVNTLSRQFYSRHGAVSIDEGFELSHTNEARLMTTKYCLRYELGACLKTPNGERLKGPLYIVNNGKRFALEFDCRQCEMIVKKGS